MNNNKKEKLPTFQYILKIKTAIYVFVLFLLLSTNTAYKILNIIFNNTLILLNDKNEPNILARFIMAFIISLLVFIF